MCTLLLSDPEVNFQITHLMIIITRGQKCGYAQELTLTFLEKCL
jgi:hypothetical protein